MTRTTTYFVQDRKGVIEELNNEYGAFLQRITFPNKLALLAILSTKLYFDQPELKDEIGNGTEFLATDVMDAFNFETLNQQDDLFDAIADMHDFSEDELIGFFMALSDHLYDHLRSGKQ